MRQNSASIIIIALLASTILFACGGGGGGGGAPAQRAKAMPVSTPVGTAIGSAITTTIGAAGGTLTSLDSTVTLSIPPGALAADTAIGIQAITNHAHGGKGSAYRFTPDGQTFQKPVALTFTYTDADLEGTAAQALGAAYQSADGYWHWLLHPTLDATAKTVTISTAHFTDYAYVNGFNLRPLSATVKVGKTVNLHVKYCYPASGGVEIADEITTLPLGRECASTSRQDELNPLLPPVSAWTVAGAGSVSDLGYNAVYTAPQAKPTPNTAVVTARINNTSLGTMFLLSHITIVDEFASYTGSYTFHTSRFYSATDDLYEWSGSVSSVTYKLSSTGPGLSAYDLDPTNVLISFDRYTRTTPNLSCTLVSASPGAPTGSLFKYGDAPSNVYYYALNASVSVTAHCVQSDPRLEFDETRSIPLDIATGSANGIPFVTDESTIIGSEVYVSDNYAYSNTWSFSGQ